MAIPTFVGAGAQENSTGAVSVAWAAGHETNDLALLAVETANELVATPSGWTQLSVSPQGTGTAGGTAATRLTVFYRRATSNAEANVSLADAGNHIWAKIFVFRGVDPTGDPWNAINGSILATASATVTIPSITTTVNDCLIVGIVANGIDANQSQVETFTNNNLSNLTSVATTNTNQGNGGGVDLVYGGKATAGAIGTTTGSLKSSSTQGIIVLALKPQPPFPVSVAIATTYPIVFSAEAAYQGDLPPIDLTPNLRSHWKFNETTGLTREDIHGTNDLSATNAPWNNTGKLGQAVEFINADSTRFLIDNTPDTATGSNSFTYSGWFYYTANGQSFPNLLEQLASGDRGVVIYISASVPGLRFSTTFDGSTQSTASQSGSLTQNTWYFFVGWWDAAARTMNIQINNGTVISSTANVPASGDPWQSSAQLVMGKSFDGRLDSWSFWDRALTADERTALYNTGIGLDYENFTEDTGGTTDPKSGTDSLAISISEIATIQQTVSYVFSDMLGLTLSETNTGQSTALRTDSLSITLTEARTALLSKQLSDALNISITEATSLANFINIIDTLGLTISEIGQLATVLTRSDSLSVTTSEVVANAVTLARNDTIGISFIEAILTASFLSRPDAFSLSIAEVRTVASVLNRADALGISLSEQRTQQGYLSRADTISLALSESTVNNLFISRSDTTSILLTETQNSLSTLLRNDGLSVSLSEVLSKGILMYLLRSDTLGVSFVDTAAIQSVIAILRSDTLGLTLSEARSIASRLSRGDSVGISLSDSMDIFSTLYRTDAAGIGISDTNAGYSNATRQDVLDAALIEAARMFLAKTIADTGVVNFTEVSSLDITQNVEDILKDGTDLLAVTIIENLSKLVLRQISSTDMVGITFSESARLVAHKLLQESLAISLSENQRILKEFNTFDTISISLAEKLSIDAVKEYTDTLNITVQELLTVSSRLSTSDPLGVSLGENVIRLAASEFFVYDTLNLLLVETLRNTVTLADTFYGRIIRLTSSLAQDKYTGHLSRNKLVGKIDKATKLTSSLGEDILSGDIDE